MQLEKWKSFSVKTPELWSTFSLLIFWQFQVGCGAGNTVFPILKTNKWVNLDVNNFLFALASQITFLLFCFVVIQDSLFTVVTSLTQLLTLSKWVRKNKIFLGCLVHIQCFTLVLMYFVAVESRIRPSALPRVCPWYEWRVWVSNARSEPGCHCPHICALCPASSEVKMLFYNLRETTQVREEMLYGVTSFHNF